MQGTAPLSTFKFVTLDASGNGTVSLGPTGFGELWTQIVVSVHASTNIAEATCRVYTGPSADAQYLSDATTNGSTGDASSSIPPAVPTGQNITAVWSGGDPGATAYLTLSGVRLVAGAAQNSTGVVMSAAGGNFKHDIAGGSGNLIVKSLQSPNFVTEVSGWQISKDGSAEFNNVTIRGGEVIGGITLIYNGTPALGNLVFSISGTSGTDRFGNPYIAGFVAYGTSGGYAGLVTMSGEAGLVLPPGGTSHMVNPPQVFSASSNPGAANEVVLGVLFSGNETPGGNSAVQVFSETADGSTPARGSLIISGTQVLGWNATGITASQPITSDTWHIVTPPANTSGTLRYTLLPFGWVGVDCHLTVASGAASGTLALITGLASGYTPASDQRGGGFGYFTNALTTVAALAAVMNMRWNATTGGAFQILAFPGGASGAGITELDFTVFYPLN